MRDMKVGKRKKNTSTHTKTYHKNLAIWKKKSFETWRIWAIVSMKTLCVGQNLAKFHHIALGGDALKLSQKLK